MANNNEGFIKLAALFLMASLLNCLELVKINSTLLPLWYDDLAICMLDNPKLQYPQAVEYCWQKWPNRRGFYSLPTEGSLSVNFNGHCSTLDMPLADRGFDLGSDCRKKIHHPHFYSHMAVSYTHLTLPTILRV